MLKLKRNSIFLIAVCTIALIFSVSFIGNFDNSGDTNGHFQTLIIEKDMEESVKQLEEKSEKLIVDIKGAVVKPGVYEMNRGERVVHAVEKASGFMEEANRDAINLALILEDEMVIFVPKYGDEEIEKLATTVTTSKDNGKININTATAEELEKIPGIGPAKASAIISYRDEFGKFKSVDDLVNVSGIGKKTVEKMVDFIDVK